LKRDVVPELQKRVLLYWIQDKIEEILLHKLLKG